MYFHYFPNTSNMNSDKKKLNTDIFMKVEPFNYSLTCLMNCVANGYAPPPPVSKLHYLTCSKVTTRIELSQRLHTLTSPFFGHLQ